MSAGMSLSEAQLLTAVLDVIRQSGSTVDANEVVRTLVRAAGVVMADSPAFASPTKARETSEAFRKFLYSETLFMRQHGIPARLGFVPAVASRSPIILPGSVHG